MALVYMICALVILVQFSAHIVPVMRQIVVAAFDPAALGGGLAGISVREAIRFGVARGLFSNEAGMGSTPHAHATAQVAHPVQQGMVAFIGVFIDTLLVCTATALIILLTDANLLGLKGAAVTQEAFHIAFRPLGAEALGRVRLRFFAFTTIIGWYYSANRISAISSNAAAWALTARWCCVPLCSALWARWMWCGICRICLTALW